MGSSDSKLQKSDSTTTPTWKRMMDKHPKGSVQVCIRPPKYYINNQK